MSGTRYKPNMTRAEANIYYAREIAQFNREVDNGNFGVEIVRQVFDGPFIGDHPQTTTPGVQFHQSSTVKTTDKGLEQTVQATASFKR